MSERRAGSNCPCERQTLYLAPSGVSRTRAGRGWRHHDTLGGITAHLAMSCSVDWVQFRIGEVDGRIIDRLLALHDALRAVQEVEVTANIAGYLWAKLALGAIYFCDGAGQRRRDGAVPTSRRTATCSAHSPLVRS